MLLRVVAPTFVAGLVIEAGRCTGAAPILRRACLGKSVLELRTYFRLRGWDVKNVWRR
jgi:hypothetical protein